MACTGAIVAPAANIVTSHEDGLVYSDNDVESTSTAVMPNSACNMAPTEVSPTACSRAANVLTNNNDVTGNTTTVTGNVSCDKSLNRDGGHANKNAADCSGTKINSTSRTTCSALVGSS